MRLLPHPPASCPVCRARLPAHAHRARNPGLKANVALFLLFRLSKMAAASACWKWLGLVLVLGLLAAALGAEEPQGSPGGKATQKKKDIRDYNDADMARLLEQWEVGEERRGACPEASSRPPPIPPSLPRCRRLCSAQLP